MIQEIRDHTFLN